MERRNRIGLSTWTPTCVSIVTCEHAFRHGLLGACQGNQVDLVNYMLKRTPTASSTLAQCMKALCEHGHWDILRDTIYKQKRPKKQLQTILNNGMIGAAIGGHIALFYELLELSQNEKFDKLDIQYSLNRSAVKAAQYGHLELLKKLCDPYKSGNNSNDHDDRGEREDTMDNIFFDACMCGRIEVVQYIFELKKETPEQVWSPVVLDNGLMIAALHGFVDIAQYLLEHGAERVNNAALHAARDQQHSMVHFLIKQGANDFEEIFFNSCSCGDIDMVRHLVSTYPIKNYQGGLASAWGRKSENVHHGNCEVMDLLLTLGATDLHDLMKSIRIPVFQRVPVFHWVLQRNFEVPPEFLELNNIHLFEIKELLNRGCPPKALKRLECFGRSRKLIRERKEKLAQMEGCLSAWLPLDIIQHCIYPYVAYEGCPDLFADVTETHCDYGDNGFSN
jgi:ankyrin repeat protein